MTPHGGRRRQPRQPLQRPVDDLHDREPRAVPARVEPVHGGRRPHRRRGGYAGDQVGDQPAARLGVRVRARQEADAKDYFTKQANGAKPPFSRQQFGGSIGGPIIQNRMFFFGAIEQQLEDAGTFVPQASYDQLECARHRDELAGRLPQGWVYPQPPAIRRRSPAGCGRTRSKTNLQLNNAQSLMFRYAGQNERPGRGDLLPRTTTTGSRTT